jgi:hypothetical protein
MSEMRRDARRRLGADGGFPARCAAAKRGLTQPQTADPPPGEEAIHPLENDAGEVLDLNSRRPLDPQHKDAGLWGLSVRRPRPLDFIRLGMLGDLRADDLAPARHELGRDETLLGERRIERPVQDVRQWSWEGFAGLVHAARLCHIALP